MRDGTGCRTCPAYTYCTVEYRGSRCAALRAKYDKGDPLTNADRIRAMTDEEMADYLRWHNDSYARYGMDWLDWLKQEVQDA